MKKLKTLVILAGLALVGSLPTKTEALPVPTNGPGVTGCYIGIGAVAVFGTVLAYPTIICPSSN